MRSQRFQVFGVRGGEGSLYDGTVSAASEVQAAAQAFGVTASEYAAQQADIERAAAERRAAERTAASVCGPEVLRQEVVIPQIG